MPARSVSVLRCNASISSSENTLNSNCRTIVYAKSPFGSSTSSAFRYSIASRKYASASSLRPFPSTWPASLSSNVASPIKSSATFANAMSSSRIGPWPHHSERRCPSTRRSSPSRSRYGKNASVVAREVMSENAHTARHLVELRVPVRFVVSWIEERTHVLRRRRGDRRARDDPDAHRFTAARVHIACVLQRLLGGGCMNASGMFVRLAFWRLQEHLPQRPLRVVGHAASDVDCCCFAAYAAAATRTHSPSSCALRRAARRSRLHGPSPFTTRHNSSQSIA